MKHLAPLVAIYAVVAALVLPSSILAQEESAPSASGTTAAEPAGSDAAAPAQGESAPDAQPETAQAAEPETAPGAQPETAPAAPADPAPAGQPAPAAPAPQFLADERANSSKPKARAAANGGVTIADFAFSPTTVTVNEGDTVTWTNNGPTPHSATASDGSFDTGILAKGQTGSHAFDVPGTYSYFCQPHPYMKATVVVQAAQTSGTTGETGGGTTEGTDGTGGAEAAQTDAGPSLPNTGSDAGALLVLGALMLLLGLAVQRRSRPRDPQPAGRIGW
jgi:LPXTG-motif cell wall-anchored protein